MNNDRQTTSVRTEHNFNVDRMTISDLDKLSGMYAEYLNYGEGVHPHCESVLNDPNTVAVKCMDGDETIGILVYTKGIALSGSHPQLISELERRLNGKTVYTCDAVMVDKRYRSLGVVEIMNRDSIRRLIDKGAVCALHEMWVYPDGIVPGYKLPHYFSHVEFIGRFEMFYKDFHHFGYYCPICGEDCICGADIYITSVP